MTLIGKKAPSFKAPAVINGNQIIQNFSLDHYKGKQSVVLFFYPKDFTFVCPTELHALQQKSHAFAQRNTAIVACSTDTEETHWAWLHVDRSQGGIKGIQYPLIADTSKTIATNFGVLGGSWYIDDYEQMQFEGTPIAYRGIFLIDKKSTIRHILINDLSLGRNIDEILRTIDMMHHTDKYGEVCPANWKTGDTAFNPTTQALLDYLAENRTCKCNRETCPCQQGNNCSQECLPTEPSKHNTCQCNKMNCQCQTQNSHP